MDVKQSSCGAAELPWKTRLAIHSGCFLLDVCRLSHRILRFLRNLEPKSPPSSKAINGVSSSDITVDPSSNLWFRLYLPSSSSSTSSSTITLLPLLIYFHGGGFLSSAANSKTYDLFCRNLAAHLQVTVASVNYRLAPNHRYPSQYDDGFETLKFIDAHNYAVLPSNIDLNRCFLAGDSAGGNIAHHVAVRYGRHEFEKLNIIGLVEIQPFFGGEERSESELRLSRVLNVKRTDWMWRLFLPIGSDRNHEAVSGGDVSAAVKFPATLVVVGGGDPLQDWQRRYVGGLKKSGKEVKLIEYPNAIHGFYIFPELPQLWYLLAEVGDFIQSQSARNA